MVTLQSLSGTGSLRVAAEFIGKFLPGTTAYLSNPTWGNHKVPLPALREVPGHACPKVLPSLHACRTCPPCMHAAILWQNGRAMWLPTH